MPEAVQSDQSTERTVADDGRRWSMLTLVAFAELLGMSVWFAANAVSVQLAAQYQLTQIQTAWLSTIVQVGFVLGTAAAAILNLADALSSRWYFSCAALLAALANVALLVAPTYGSALACRALTGAFLAGVYPPAMKMAATWFRSQRGLAIGVVVGALTIGKATPYLIHAVPGAGVSQVVIAASLAATFAGLLVAVAYRDGPAPFPRRPFDAALVRAVLRDSKYRQVLGGYSGHMLELYACWVWIPTFIAASVVAHGDAALTSATLTNLLSFVVLAAGAVGCIAGGALADRFGYVRFVIGAMVVSGLCAVMTPLVFGKSTVMLTVLLLVWSVSVIADSAQFSTLVTKVVPAHAVGTALTLQTSIGFLLTTITIQLVPVVASHTGWQYAFPFLAFGPAIGIAAVRRLKA